MRQPKTYTEHEVAPKEWRHTPDMTGSYELDAAIQQCPNKDMAGRIEMYLKRSAGYGARTAYSGYNGYSGDD